MSDTKTLLLLCLLFVFALPSKAYYPGNGNTGTTGIRSLNFFAASGIQSTIQPVLTGDSIRRAHEKGLETRSTARAWIAPAALISGGTALHFMAGTKEQVRDFMESNLAWHSRIDDYLQYAPLATVYGLTISGVRGENNFGNITALALKSFLLNGLFTDRLKYWINEERPNGGVRSFPSGHTSKAFSFAHFMHKEYGALSPWFSIGAYTCAATVGYMRVAKSAHWVSDVLMGAGIGILSTELVYRTHQYKWDNEHLKRFDIFPFQLGEQKGLTLVCTF